MGSLAPPDPWRGAGSAPIWRCGSPTGRAVPLRGIIVGAFTPIHWILVALVVLVLFGGRGKLSGLMGDAGKGIRAFRDGLKDAGLGGTPASDTPAAKVESSKEEPKG